MERESLSIFHYATIMKEKEKRRGKKKLRTERI